MAAGRKIEIYPCPKEITYFLLAKEFGWLPSQIDNENCKKIEGVITVMSTYNKVQNKEMEKITKKTRR